MTENGQQQSEQNGKYHPLRSDLQHIDDSRAPSQPAGVWSVVGMLANRLKVISGRSTWQDTPPTNLTEAHAHQQNKENPHNTTRAQLGAAAQTALDSHTAARDNPHGVTAAQAGARPATWVPGWNDVTSKPSTYPPSTHTHDYAPSSHVGSGGSAHANAVANGAAGFMTGAEKAKLDGLSSGPSYATDGSTPLKYSAFLSAASGDHDVAMQSAIAALFSGNGSYQRHLDLEGASVVLTQQVSAPVGNFQVRSIYNGEIIAGQSWSTGGYLLSFMGAGNQHLRFVNLTFIGSNRCSWVKWDDGDFLFEACHFRNNNPNGDPGLECLGSGHYHVRDCHATVNEGSTAPDQRTHVGFHATYGDLKISGLTMSYFRHSIINEGGTFTIDNLHVFQGVSGQSSTTHTAGIKLTGGYVGTLITNLYLDKCFIEVSNQTNPGAARIGGLRLIGVTTLLASEDPSFAYIVARDYHNKTGLPLEDMTITGGQFVNYASTTARLTKIVPDVNFNRNAFAGITVADNTFAGAITPQANPLRMRKTFTSVLSHQFQVDGYLPFQARLSAVLSAEAVRSGSDIPVLQPSINAANNIANIYTSTAWAGDIVVSMTTNPSGSDGFMVN